MKPTKLTIEGLNSFSEEQVIDFEILCAEGIFGIFGPTGSGKSTVLDAITFALYGRIARENSAKSSSEVINLNRESARVVFEFQINAKEQSTYKVLREIKRTKQGGITTSQVKIFDITEDEIILAEKEKAFNEAIADIIGLQYEDFVKTVVLPQGGFNEFLKMEGLDRRKVLERLFNLEKYGEELYKKVSRRQYGKINAKTAIDGELRAYEGLSHESLKTQKEAIAEKEREEKELKNQKEKNNEETENIKKNYQLQIQLKEAKELLRQEEAKAEIFEKLKIEIENSQKYAVVEAQAMDYQEQLTKGKSLKEELEKLEINLETLQKSQEDMETAYKKAEEDQNHKLPKLIEKKAKLENSLESFNSYHTSLKTLESLKEEIKTIDSGEQKAQIQMKKIQEEKIKLEAKIQEQKKEIESALSGENQRESLQRAAQLMEKIRDLKNTRDALEKEAQALMGISDEMLRISQSKDQQEENISVSQARLRSIEKNLQQLKLELDQLPVDREEDPKALLEQLAERDEYIDKLRKEIKIQERELKNIENLVEENVKSTRSLELSRAKIQTEEKQQKEIVEKEKIRLINLLGQIEDPQKQLKICEREIIRIQSNFKALKTQRDSMIKEMQKNQDQVNVTKTGLKMARDTIRKIQEELYEKLEKMQICQFSQLSAGEKSLELSKKITEIAGWKLSEAQIKEKEEKIITHNRLIDQTQGRINNLLEQSGKEPITEEAHRAAIEKNQKINEEHNQLIKLISALASQHDENLRRLERAQVLMAENKKLEKDLSILKELSSILNGRKFVEFMAINQLKYVTLKATEMLDKITGGSYALEVDDSGIFKIRDNKNGGELRSVKNLSGGETFLVSLSLALALSAQIQLKGVAPLELFFLDEGFGTLDDNLLDTVMESLEKVHHDKLKIGLISHVEQLKQRIPVKLTVTPAKSGVSGSRTTIEYS